MSFDVIKIAKTLVPRVWLGKRISNIKSGDGLRRPKLQEIVDCINPFLSLEVRRGSSDAVILTDAKCVIQLLDDMWSATSGGGGMRYRQLWSSANDYALNDVVYTTPDLNTRILWIAEAVSGPHTSPGSQTPVFPEGMTVYWRCLAMFKSGGVNYRGIYDASKDYSVNDLVYTETTTIGVITRTPFICETANTHSSPQTPTFPESGTVYWRCLAGFSGCTPQYHYFQDVNNSCANMKFIYIGQAPIAA